MYRKRLQCGTTTCIVLYISQYINLSPVSGRLPTLQIGVQFFGFARFKKVELLQPLSPLDTRSVGRYANYI